jgi:hypothetical protein
MLSKKMDVLLIRFPDAPPVFVPKSDNVLKKYFNYISKTYGKFYASITTSHCVHVEACSRLISHCFDTISEVRVIKSLYGGKGGFGSNLKKQGGKLSKKRKSNISDCRDIAGNRLKTLRDSRLLTEYIEAKSSKNKKKEILSKLEKLETHTQPLYHPSMGNSIQKQSDEAIVYLASAFSEGT